MRNFLDKNFNEVSGPASVGVTVNNGNFPHLQTAETRSHMVPYPITRMFIIVDNISAGPGSWLPIIQSTHNHGLPRPLIRILRAGTADCSTGPLVQDSGNYRRPLHYSLVTAATQDTQATQATHTRYTAFVFQVSRVSLASSHSALVCPDLDWTLCWRAGLISGLYLWTVYFYSNPLTGLVLWPAAVLWPRAVSLIIMDVFLMVSVLFWPQSVPVMLNTQ